MLNNLDPSPQVKGYKSQLAPLKSKIGELQSDEKKAKLKAVLNKFKCFFRSVMSAPKGVLRPMLIAMVLNFASLLLMVVLGLLILKGMNRSELIKNPVNRDDIGYKVLSVGSLLHPYFFLLVGVMALQFFSFIFWILACVALKRLTPLQGRAPLEVSSTIYANLIVGGTVLALILFIVINMILDMRRRYKVVKRLNSFIFDNIYKLNSSKFLGVLNAATYNTVSLMDAMQDAMKNVAGSSTSSNDLAKIIFTFNMYRNLQDLGVTSANYARATQMFSTFSLLRQLFHPADFFFAKRTYVRNLGESLRAPFLLLTGNAQTVNDAVLKAASYTETVNNMANAMGVEDALTDFSKRLTISLCIMVFPWLALIALVFLTQN